MEDVPPVLEIKVSENSRFDRIKQAFQEKYGEDPTFLSRASGRVNLIGEHIDYCGYAVLPMAIEQDVVIAARPNDFGVIRLSNTNPKLYPDFSTKTTEIIIDRAHPLWQHYFLCGYRGVLEHCHLDAPRGLDVMVDGKVPPSAGLSSSSALVCAAAMTTSRANGQQLSKSAFAELCQRCERYIGTEGGGMDQAISFLAEPDTAKLIEFNPLKTTDVKIPKDSVFVISNCCRELNKASTSHYNTRVAECRLACQVIAKKKGLDWRECRILGDLQQSLSVSISDMVAMVKDVLHEEPYTRAEVCEILEVTTEELNKISLSEKTFHLETFKLYNRALHVFSEAERVWQFKRVCDEAASDVHRRLGDLMNASHASCSASYECSCEELDILTQLCRDSGALGSRLTGAGWGGCAVSLVPSDRLTSFLAAVTEGYYKKLPPGAPPVEEALFASKPGGGAAFYILS